MDRFTHFQDNRWCVDIDGNETSGSWVDRLAEYENLGLEPSDIRSILQSISHSAGQPNLYDQPWENILKLSTRATNCLRRSKQTYGKTVRELANTPSLDIRIIRNLGVVTRKEVATALNRIGIYGTDWEEQ